MMGTQKKKKEKRGSTLKKKSKRKGKDRHKVKLHSYLDKLVKMMPRNVICWHPKNTFISSALKMS